MQSATRDKHRHCRSKPPLTSLSVERGSCETMRSEQQPRVAWNGERNADRMSSANRRSRDQCDTRTSVASMRRAGKRPQTAIANPSTHRISFNLRLIADRPLAPTRVDVRSFRVRSDRCQLQMQALSRIRVARAIETLEAHLMRSAVLTAGRRQRKEAAHRERQSEHWNHRRRHGCGKSCSSSDGNGGKGQAAKQINEGRVCGANLGTDSSRFVLSRSFLQYGLYSYWRSGASWRVRIALAYKGIPYDYHPINLLKNEQATGAYAALNPQHKVPLLVIAPGRSISQSVAIIDYLEQAHPDKPSLLPKDPYLRAKSLSLAEGFNADTQPLQNLHVLNKIQEITGSADKKKEWIEYVLKKGLAAFEADVAQTTGKFCVGDNITIADVFLVPQLGTARRFEIDLAPYPNIVRIDANLASEPAFKAGHPDAQPDKPAA